MASLLPGAYVQAQEIEPSQAVQPPIPSAATPSAETPSSPPAETPAPPAEHSGETVYVSDLLYITLRSAPDPQAESIKVVPSGTPMAMLARGEPSGFSRVRLESGEEGWVLQRYLTEQPIAADRLEAIQQRLDNVEADKSRLESEVRDLRAKRSGLSTEAERLAQENKTLKTELAEIKKTSAEALDLAEESRRTSAALAAETAKRTQAEQDAAAARDRLRLFAAGAGLLGLGLGFYIGYTPVRREKKWRRMPRL